VTLSNMAPLTLSLCIFLCSTPNGLASGAEALSSFGIRTTGTLSQYEPVVLTLWWETTISQCTLYPELPNEWALCYEWAVLEVPCPNPPAVEVVEYKLMIEYNGTGSLSVDAVIVQFSFIYYAITEWNFPDDDGDGVYFKTDTLCMGSGGGFSDCSPSKQMSFFDIYRPNCYLLDAVWANAAAVDPQSDALSRCPVITDSPSSVPSTAPTVNPSTVPTAAPSAAPTTTTSTAPTLAVHTEDGLVRTTFSDSLPEEKSPTLSEHDGRALSAWSVTANPLVPFLGFALVLVAVVALILFCRHRRASKHRQNAHIHCSCTATATATKGALRSLAPTKAQSDRLSVDDDSKTLGSAMHRVGEVSVYHGSDRDEEYAANRGATRCFHDELERIRIDRELAGDIDVEYIGDLVGGQDSNHSNPSLQRMETPETAGTPDGAREELLEQQCALSLIGSEGIAASIGNTDGMDTAGRRQRKTFML